MPHGAGTHRPRRRRRLPLRLQHARRGNLAEGQGPDARLPGHVLPHHAAVVLPEPAGASEVRERRALLQRRRRGANRRRASASSAKATSCCARTTTSSCPPCGTSKEIIAYSRTGYENKTWRLPEDWRDVKSVDLYRITLEGLVPARQEVPATEGRLVLSLAAGEALAIVPAGMDPAPDRPPQGRRPVRDVGERRPQK